MPDESQEIETKEVKGDTLLANKELEKVIETVIKRDTPHREVYFENYIVEEDLDEVYHFEVYTKNPNDPFMLLLKKQEVSVKKSLKALEQLHPNNRNKIFQHARNEFLQELRNEIVNKESSRQRNRYWVEWFYKEKHKKEEAIHRTSHFIGKGVKDIVDKLENSVPKDYEYEIKKIELLPES